MVDLKRFLALSLLLLVVFATVGCSGSEDDFGRVRGKITLDGNVLVGVEVSIADKSDITDSEGLFEIEELATGSATLKVTEDGKEIASKNIVINEGDNNLGEIDLYVFKPEEDYPVRDLSDASRIYLKTTTDEKYDLNEKEPGLWIGNFDLPAGTEYKIKYEIDDNTLYLPIMSDNYLEYGKEDEIGIEGSFDFVSDYDDAVLTHWQLIGIATGIDNPESYYDSNAEIVVDGQEKSSNQIADTFASRELKHGWYNIEYHYKNSLEAEVSGKADELRKEEYTLAYDDGWKITELDSYVMDYLKVSETDGVYRIELDLELAVEKNKDFADYSVEDYERIVLIGFFNDWIEDETEDYNYTSEVNDNSNIVSLEISDEDDIEKLNDTQFKIAAITEDGDFSFAPSGFGGQRSLSLWKKITN